MHPKVEQKLAEVGMTVRDVQTEELPAHRGRHRPSDFRLFTWDAPRDIVVPDPTDMWPHTSFEQLGFSGVNPAFLELKHLRIAQRLVVQDLVLTIQPGELPLAFLVRSLRWDDEGLAIYAVADTMHHFSTLTPRQYYDSHSPYEIEGYRVQHN